MNNRRLDQFSLETLHALADGFGAATAAVGTPLLPAMLGQALERLMPADEVVITRFAECPVAELFVQHVRVSDDDIATYLGGAYLLDPYYRAGLDRRFSGFSTYTALAPEGFRQSEYYRRYLINVGLVDECGYLVQFSNGQFINVSLGRHAKAGTFNESELALLRSLEPLIHSLCQLHWEQIFSQEFGEGELKRQLDEALATFGASKLTRRECEVIRLLLHGHSSNSIAERLFISPETVRLHRRNSYRKLDIGSQSELFNLFIDSLMRPGTYDGGDPLEGYF